MEQDKTKELKNMKRNQISLKKSRQHVNKFKNLLINKDELKTLNYKDERINTDILEEIFEE